MSIYVRPLAHPVRDPITREYIPAAGVEVPENAYWLTRIRHGDVAEAERPAPVTKPEQGAEAEAAPEPHPENQTVQEHAP